MRNLLSFLLLLYCASSLIAQYNPIPPEYEQEYNPIPPEYEQEYDRLQQEYGGYDFRGDEIRLHPLDHLFIAPSEVAALNNGNWSHAYLGIDNYRQYVIDNATGKVVFIILDTAGELDHINLSEYELKKYSKTWTGSKRDGHGHGTHVAGCIGGKETSYRLGPASILFQMGKAKFIMLKGLSDQGSGSTTNLNKAMDYATSIAPKLHQEGYNIVFNGSFGGSGQSASMDAAVKRMEQAGILPVFAAGNSGGSIGTPANGPSAHSIGAQNSNGSAASFSSFGTQQYAAAPGVRILSTMPRNGYAEMSGTSMAAPVFAGCAGVIWSLNPKLTNRQASHYTRFYVSRMNNQQWSPKLGWGSPTYTDTWIKDAPIEGLPNSSNGNPDTANPPYGDDNPDPDPDPDPEPDPPADKRTLDVQLNYEYPVIWRANNSTEWRRTAIRMDVAYTSRLKADVAHDAIATGTAAFFTNRGFVLMDDDDVAEAGYWVRHFYEMIMQSKGYDVEVTDYHNIDEQGRKLTLDKNRRGKVRFALTRLFTGISTQELYITQ